MLSSGDSIAISGHAPIAMVWFMAYRFTALSPLPIATTPMLIICVALSSLQRI
jgi:hypothetical protein